MRVLVTGSHGFVGSHLRRLLQERGVQVIGLGRSARIPDSGEDYIVADLEKRGETVAAISEVVPDAIVHLAGDTGRGTPALRTLDTNVVGTMHVMEGASRLRTRCRVLVIGTSAQYGRVPEHELPVREETELRAEGAYGWSKNSAERLALSYQGRSQVEVVAVRPFNHLGPGEPSQFVASGFARQIVEIEAGAEPVIHVGNLDPVRDLTDVRDIVRGYADLLVGGQAGTVYNLCSGRGVRMGDLLQMFLKRSGVRAEVRPDARRIRPGELPVQIGTAARAKRDFGWEPKIPLEQSVDDLLEDWRTKHRVGARREDA